MSPMNTCPKCEGDENRPSFKGNQVRGSECMCDEIEPDDSQNVKWHWNPLIRSESPEES